LQGDKAAGATGWPFTSVWSRDWYCVVFYLHSPHTCSWCGAET